MIDSSSIGNSDTRPSRAIDAAADALEPHGVAEALAQHLHQVGAEPVAGFLRRDQKYLSRDVGGRARRHHAGRPVTKRPALSAASIIACGSATIVLPATIGNAGEPGVGRTFDGSRPHRRQVEAQILPALGRLHQHAAAGLGANAALRAQPRHARQQPVGALDVFDRRPHDRRSRPTAWPMSNGLSARSTSPPPGDIGAGVRDRAPRG